MAGRWMEALSITMKHPAGCRTASAGSSTSRNHTSKTAAFVVPCVARDASASRAAAQRGGSRSRAAAAGAPAG